MTQTDQQNVPKLRFQDVTGNDFPDWEEKRLGEIVTAFSGGTPSSSNRSYYAGDIPFIGSGDISAAQVEQCISEEALASSSAKLVNEGDLLYALYGATSGEVAIAQFSGAINQAVLCIRSDENILFLFQWLRYSKAKITSTYLQGGQGNLSGKIVKTLRIPLPHPDEQRKIANFLGAVDTKIAQLARKKALLQNYKKGCMQQLFSRAIRFKDEDGNDFPDWEEKRLGEVASRVRHRNDALSTTDVLTNSAVHGVVSQGDYFDHDVAKAENLDRYTIVQVGDFVYNPRISGSAPVGPIKRNNLRVGVMSPLYDVFRFNRDENLDFWEQYFSATRWYKYMKQVANYGARHDRMAISSGDFIAMPLPYPHPDEQRKTADFLSTLDRKIDLVGRELTHARSFKQGLLQQVFV